jgi:hypothetical protein
VRRDLRPMATEQLVRLSDIVGPSLGLLRQLSAGCGVEVFYGDAASTPVRVSGEAIERILANLVTNAAAAMANAPGTPAAGTAIRIGVGFVVNRWDDTEPLHRRVRLTVEDDGCGMSAAELHCVLRPVRPGLPGGRGTGIRIVQDLVERSGGHLLITSAPGKGTSVQIEWPSAAHPSASTASGLSASFRPAPFRPAAITPASITLAAAGDIRQGEAVDEPLRRRPMSVGRDGLPRMGQADSSNTNSSHAKRVPC